ncbi:MAG: SDR family NAD(P)-dependent oxidoreductase [Gammaproteobacteria bacterium]|nr:SDR family NAD(P)-dependent oxidoreductase [Gammaproteobacteria bacterium]
MATLEINGKVAWVTGASYGIGRALALELGRRGARVAVSARSTEKLESLVAEIGSDKALAVPFDVTDQEANNDAAAKIASHFGAMDIVVFNAGSCEYVNTDKFDSALFERMMKINFLSMVYGIEAVLPYLRKSSDPLLVGMSSTAAYGGLPRSEAYGASKAAIRNMLASLRLDLASDGIPVSVICPGFVKTPLTDKNDFPMPMQITAEEAATAICKGIERRTQEIHFPKRFSLFLKFLTSLPSPIYSSIMQRTVRK